jgi:hypothetical protein
MADQLLIQEIDAATSESITRPFTAEELELYQIMQSEDSSSRGSTEQTEEEIAAL